jgi:hypothetical protein
LIYSVNQMGKAQFLRDLARNTARGLLTSAREGKAGTGGRPPNGYRSGNGEVDVVLVEAEIVRLIFDLYLAPGGSLVGVAAELNRRLIPTPSEARSIKKASKRVWRNSTVKSILTNEKYLGSFKFGSRNGGRYYAFRDGEVIPRRKADGITKAEPIVIEDKFEAIIDQETFDKVQGKLQSRKGKTSPKRYRQYLLTGLVRCGDCGGMMGGVKSKQESTYRCRQYQQTGHATCYCNTIKEAPLVNCIVRKIQERYLSDSGLTRLRTALEEEQRRRRPRPQDDSDLRRQIGRLDRKLEQGAERVLDAPTEIVPTLYRKIEQLKSERDGLEFRLRDLTSQKTRSPADDKAEIERAISALKDLGEALTRANPAETKELLSSIVTKKVRINYFPIVWDE